MFCSMLSVLNNPRYSVAMWLIMSDIYIHTAACIRFVNNIMETYCVNMQKSLFFLISDGYSPLYKHIKLWDVVCLKQRWQETIIKMLRCY